MRKMELKRRLRKMIERRKVLCTVKVLKDKARLWKEWLFKTIRMKNIKITNTTGLKEKI